jgi:hypothetical protein
MTEVLGLEDDDQDLASSPKGVLSPNASSREIEVFYEQSRLRIVQERNDFFLPHVVDFIEDRAWGNLRPEYQRRLRWTEDKKSQLIESFIMNVPVPPVFLFEPSLGEFEVMDGQQRLSAIVDFLQNRFELSGLKVWPPLNGRRFADLPATLKRALNRSKVSAITLSAEGVSRDASIDLRTQVFERLNTGGERLNAQELRNSIYGGPFNGMLLEISGLPEFTEAWEIPSHDENIDADGTPSELLRSNNLYKRMSDVEIVLRFYAFLNDDLITGSVRRMLDQTMERGMSLSKERLQSDRNLFIGSIRKARALLGPDVFRMPRRSDERMTLSRPLFDAVMVAIARLEVQWPSLTNAEAGQDAMDAIKNPASSTYDLLVGRANTAQAIKDRIRLVGDALAATIR